MKVPGHIMQLAGEESFRVRLAIGAARRSSGSLLGALVRAGYTVLIGLCWIVCAGLSSLSVLFRRAYAT